MPSRLRRPGLLAAALLFLVAGFLPCLEVMGESASLLHLAWSGFETPWCWVILFGGLLPAGAGAFVRSARLAGGLALLAAVPSLVALAVGWTRFGSVMWSILRSGAYGMLAGAAICLVCAAWWAGSRRSQRAVLQARGAHAPPRA